jgi:tetratricopeptide (TPR) repeat protein
MSSLERLEQFLRDAFSVDEVRRLWSSYNREQGHSLPGEPASLVAVVGAGVDLLRRHRPDEKFFTLLRDSRPNRSREIDALERSLVAPAESTPGRLFLAYPTRSADAVGPLAEALRARGITVDSHCNDGATIAGTTRDILAGSHAVALLVSDDGFDDPLCAWALTSAWIAAERAGQVRRRIFLLRPHGDPELPSWARSTFRDGTTLELPAAEDGARLERTAIALADGLRGLDARPLGELHNLDARPRWYPFPRSGSERFVGRTAQLWGIHAMLTARGLPGPTLVQIRGLGGIGKSLLAIEYARRFAGAWPGGIFWVDADPSWKDAPATSQQRLARRCNMLAGLAASLGVCPTPGDLETTAQAVERAITEHTAGRPHLWIVDDLPPGLSQTAVEALLPSSPAGAVLVTTRWMGLTALPGRLDLAALDETAARTLLTSRDPPADAAERAAADALADEVGRHPLALDVLGALVRDDLSSTPYADWRTRLAAPDTEFDRRCDELLEELPTGCERAITRVLATSVTRLRSAHSLDILRIAALLADAPLPGALLADVLGRLRPSTTGLERAVAELAAHALVTREPEVRGIRVHAVVRWVARRWSVPEPSIARIEAEIRDALCEWLSQADDVQRHHELQLMVPHAEQMSRGDSMDAMIVGGSVGHFYEVCGDYHAARRHAERAVAYFTGGPVPVNPFSAVAKNNLAVALKLMGEHRAAEAYFGQALVEYEQLYGADDPRALMALHNLGTVCEAQGDYAAARRIYERALAAQLRVLGPAHRDTLRTLIHLGGILSEQGDLARSRKLLKQAVLACERALGPDHPISLDSEQMLAVTLKRLGHRQKARALEERVLTVLERSFGPEHPATLRCAQQLSSTLALLGELPAASGARRADPGGAAEPLRSRPSRDPADPAQPCYDRDIARQSRRGPGADGADPRRAISSAWAPPRAHANHPRRSGLGI